MFAKFLPVARVYLLDFALEKVGEPLEDLHEHAQFYQIGKHPQSNLYHGNHSTRIRVVAFNKDCRVALVPAEEAS